MNKKLAVYRFVGLLASAAITALAIMTRSFQAQHQGIMSAEATNQMNNSHAGNSMPEMNMSEVSGDSHAQDSHTGHSTTNQKISGMGESLQAKFAILKAVKPNQSLLLAIDIQDSTGKAIKSFDTFQEKLMHLIVVSRPQKYSNRTG